MNNAYIEELKSNFESYAVMVGIDNIKRIRVGYISDKDYVKGILSTITLHALSNLVIFDEERLQKLIKICNTVRHG